MNAGEHAPYILKRYQEFVFRDIARRLHAPHKYGEREFDDWIGRIARARGAEADPAELLTAVDGLSAESRRDGAQAARLARRLFAFKQEMTDGPGSRSNAP